VDYHYTECGLDNVIIQGMENTEDNAGNETITIPAIGMLHQVIAKGVVTQPSKMGGRELRFLRTEMGLTQDELARVLKVTLLTISRWEREESPIKDTAEMLIRLLAVERLELDVEMSVDIVASKVTASSKTEPILIDGSNPKNYQVLAA